MQIHLTSLGCKLNQAELEEVARRFVAAGHRIAPALADADVHVVNSCTVTHVAARDSRKVARRGRRLNPGLRTVLTGCYAAADPEEAAALAGVDLVVPNADKENLVDRVLEAFPELAAEAGDDRLPVPYVPLELGRARALVKIEDGCDMRCAFCVIPLTRGRQRSRRAERVVDEVRSLSAAGFQEVVVTGVQISAYRDGEVGLYELMCRLLAETDVARLRLTSIAPWQFDPRLLELFASGRLCRHFHLSLQSGCDATLRRMLRPYTGAGFADLVAAIRAAVPGVAVTTDLIVGFPGETDSEFEDSLALAATLGFAGIHAFPYSERAGTAAAAMPDQVPYAHKRERMAHLLATARAAQQAYWRSHLGAQAEVLWEGERAGTWHGLTDNYIRVRAAGGRPSPRRLQPARLVAAAADGMTAVPQTATAGT